MTRDPELGGVVDAVIVGAGLAGLVAADELRAAGRSVTVVDKGSRPGGRLATRRIGEAVFDHGAQFFTVRSDEFSQRVTHWQAQGCPITVWGHGLAQSRHIEDGPAHAERGNDGHPRYVVAGGMNRLATHLARDLDVRAAFQATTVRRVPEGWAVSSAQGASVHGAALILTPPVPQTLVLCNGRELDLGDETRQRLEAIAYDPCLALLVTLDRGVALPDPGGVQIAEGPVQTLSDNRAKGTSPRPALTVHLRGDISRERFDEPDDVLVADALAWTAGWLGEAHVEAWELKRWRYAQPVVLDDDRAVATAVAGSPLVFAGDAFGEAKVEGAVRSGMAAARAIIGG